MISVTSCIMLVIGLIVIAVATISGVIDLKLGAPIGDTIKRWGRKIIDEFFDIP